MLAFSSASDMSKPLLRLARIRALSIASICLFLVTIASVWASRQQAGATSRAIPRHYSSAAVALPDKGGITPDATITVNSLTDFFDGNDGRCTLREAIAAVNTNEPSGAAGGECAAGRRGGAD